MGFDECCRVDEAIREGWKSIARRRRQGSTPRICLVVAAEHREMEMGSTAHACDVREHLATGDDGARPEAGSRPDVPVLSEHNPLSGLMPDEDAALECRVDYVADDHSIGGSAHRLDAGTNVDTGVQPDRTIRCAAPQDGAIAKPPLGAEAETVGLPGRERKLEIVGSLGRSHELGCGRCRAAHAGRTAGDQHPRGGEGERSSGQASVGPVYR